MKKLFSHLKHFCCLCLFVALASCAANNTNDAPIVEGWKQNSAGTSDYRVQKTDTIYSVAWAFGMDYRQLAQLNNLKEPYDLHEGQILRMSTETKTWEKPSATLEKAETIPQPAAPLPVAETQATPAVTPASTKTPSKTKTAKTTATKTTPATTAKPTPATNKTKWLWPTKGTVVRGFSATSGGNKGIDIAGRLSQPITAAGGGKVVYTGASLPGYGNLIIIKHGDSELSAYAFNKVIAVKEGQVVKAGQVIAQMGKNDGGKAILHFEIRKNGKPVNPLPYLNKK